MNEKKITYDPDWKTKYQDIITTPEQAVSHITPGQRIFIGTGCAQPAKLVEALTARAKELSETEIIHLMTFGAAPYARKDLADHFRVNSLFIADNVRDIIQEGFGDYTPIFFSDIPALFSSGQMPIDMALIQVSPPDERGMCSLGISVDIVKSAAENAAMVIAEINPQMPRTLGDSFLQVQDFDYIVPVDQPLVTYRPAEKNGVVGKIGEHISSLVERGSTIELGIGRIPHAIAKYLKGKKDLGIHTEMLTDELVELIESGAVTGDKKTLDRGRHVVSFCLGTKKVYDYVDNNPKFSFHPSEYVNDPMVIARQKKMVAINAALEVDLTGQICTDSLYGRFFSGIGGHADFIRGAARSSQGKAIIALPSTAGGGKVSRIVSHLSKGSGVVTTSGDARYVVTEYGVAYLHGKSIEERAIALISIAHPDFREQLLKESIEAGLIRQEMIDVEGKVRVGPPPLRTAYIMSDGTKIDFRTIRFTDVRLIKELHYKLSEHTIYYRHMQNLKFIPHKQVQDFVYIDHRNDMAIVGTVPAAHGEEMIAIGRYYLDQKTNRAEVAFLVRDDWHNRGIATFLFRYLITIARRNGIRGFTAEVLADNRSMHAVLHKGDCNIKSILHDGIISYELDFQ
ncbi:MAG: GNAT family N-acetyltransferase [Deltaproteobacteria bacterium]|nr:GNAT family N-acetyltransferase [Deltaproteobacteria bacterium]